MLGKAVSGRHGNKLSSLLQGTARPSGQDELQPEGNGTGFLWDDSGNLVTNYHVLQSALAAMGRRPGAQRSPQNKPVVAKITLLGMHPRHTRCIPGSLLCSCSSLVIYPSMSGICGDVCLRQDKACDFTDMPGKMSRLQVIEVGVCQPCHTICEEMRLTSGLDLLLGAECWGCAGKDGFNQTFDGTLVGADRAKDLCVLHINAPQALLHPMSLGNSQALRVGQQVLAIGNPFGFDHTLTTGMRHETLLLSA